MLDRVWLCGMRVERAFSAREDAVTVGAGMGAGGPVRDDNDKREAPSRAGARSVDSMVPIGEISSHSDDLPGTHAGRSLRGSHRRLHAGETHCRTGMSTPRTARTNGGSGGSTAAHGQHAEKGPTAEFHI